MRDTANLMGRIVHAIIVAFIIYLALHFFLFIVAAKILKHIIGGN